MQDRFWKIIKKSCQMHRKVEENLANIEKPSSIYGTVEDMVNRAGVGRGGGLLAKDMERNLVYCPSGEILRFSQYL